MQRTHVNRGLLLITLSITAWARTSPAADDHEARNLVYAEGLGLGVVYSVNVERTFGDASVRLGAGYIAGSVQPDTPGARARTETVLLSVPVSISYVGMRQDWSILEVGAGAVPLHVGAHVSTLFVSESNTSTNTVLAALYAGYRYQPTPGGLLVRAGVSAIAGKYGLLPFWPYVAAGGVF